MSSESPIKLTSRVADFGDALGVRTGEGICDWIVMGVLWGLHGSRLADGRSLAITIAEQTALYARDQDYVRMAAQVHHNHQKSLHIVGKLGFTIVRSLDDDYSLYAVDLA